MAIPETRHDGIAGAIDDPRIFWNLDFACRANVSDFPSVNYDDRPTKSAAVGAE
jgi:hypothetical protein